MWSGAHQLMTECSHTMAQTTVDEAYCTDTSNTLWQMQTLRDKHAGAHTHTYTNTKTDRHTGIHGQATYFQAAWPISFSIATCSCSFFSSNSCAGMWEAASFSFIFLLYSDSVIAVSACALASASRTSLSLDTWASNHRHV